MGKEQDKDPKPGNNRISKLHFFCLLLNDQWDRHIELKSITTDNLVFGVIPIFHIFYAEIKWEIGGTVRSLPNGVVL